MPILLGWFTCAIIAALIGSSKGETILGFIVGAIFGPLGIIFALISSGNRVPCEFCRSKVDPKASICPMCRSQRFKWEDEY